MTTNKILVVDDEPDITELITLYLERDGFDVHSTDNGEDAILLAEELKPDLIILDIQLKNLDGIEVCKKIRTDSGVPILFISCMNDDTDIIHGLTVGGDDYMTKPFSPSQLVARVKAHLRRQAVIDQSKTVIVVEEVLTFDGLVIDIPARTVLVRENEISLSTKEFELLVQLALAPNRAFPLDDLYTLVWGHDSMGDTRTLMVHISNLRKKIEIDPTNPLYITTVRGVGYKFSLKEGNTHVHR
ncbi:Alkaline phosphatase synthesis transcriptional regulatory protein PhoP [Paenibacillus plantiphilus]|uniref:Alkaline phosphatase synthesis transcriptional regulatory protein PhoP n=1 Tax=Paenibacillus plantiphilus TaxID=2905650 RepID=A0ABM9BXJ0_9BACL|nr:response regulator transcription factor [Paenibacillus plantiphilus]CAH1195871.1 Alkaline phosphatase synthesis transcriptional regulatory protein PhoP [Paenibacillus plantiphilus]